MNSSILIGPTGFLGENFLRLYPEITSVGRNTPINKAHRHIQINSEFNFEVLDNINFENVIFLIGSSDHHLINNHPTLAFEKNVLPLSKFLFYCKNRIKKPKKIFTFTTMLQYDSEKIIIPCSEDQPIKPHTNNYILSKVMAENISKTYRSFFEIIDIRLSNVYGPTHLRRPDLIPTIFNTILDGKKMYVWTKKPIRDFIFVDDLIHFVFHLSNTNYSGPINIGSGIGRSVSDVCNIIEKLTESKIYSKNLEVKGHMKFIQDLTLLKSLIPFNVTSLEKGLEKTFKKMVLLKNKTK